MEELLLFTVTSSSLHFRLTGSLIQYRLTSPSLHFRQTGSLLLLTLTSPLLYFKQTGSLPLFALTSPLLHISQTSSFFKFLLTSSPLNSDCRAHTIHKDEPFTALQTDGLPLTIYIEKPVYCTSNRRAPSYYSH